MSPFEQTGTASAFDQPRLQVDGSVLARGALATAAWTAVAASVTLLANRKVGFADPLYVSETNAGFIGWAVLLALATAVGALWSPLGRRLGRAAP